MTREDQLEDLAERTLERLGLTWDQVKLDNRTRELARKRMVLYWVLRSADMPLTEIGGMCDRDHSSVSNALRRLEEAVAVTNEKWARDMLDDVMDLEKEAISLRRENLFRNKALGYSGLAAIERARRIEKA